jgi:hypothetical protein
LASYRGRDGKRRKATIVVTFKAKDAQRAREALAALGEDAPRKPTELRLVERRLRKKERLGEVEGQLKLPRPQEAIRLFHCPLQNFERSADIQPGTVNLVLTDIPYGREFLPQLPDLAAFSQRVLAEGGIFATYCGVVDLPQVMEGIGRHLAYQAVAFSSWSGEGPLLHSTRFTTALIKKVLGKKTQPRTVKVQNESRTDTDPQMASFAASSSGEKPQGPVETVSDAVDKPVAVSQSAASEEKHESSVVIALQAAGKAVAALQIAFQAVENAEVFEGEAEHLDTIMTEITGLVAAIRERLLPVKSDEPLKLVS